MNTITTITAREILDSRGNPTVQVTMNDGVNTAVAAVPSGASTGSHEAHELRDKDKNRYHGKGVLQAIENIHTIITPLIVGQNPAEQQKLDQIMRDADGTPNKSTLGANAILGASMAMTKLAAMQQNMPLWQWIAELHGTKKVTIPRPMMNIINGGEHADNTLAVQECMIIPQFDDFADNLRAGSEIFQSLKKILKNKNLSTGVGDEGGFAPNVATTAEAFDLMEEAIQDAGYSTFTEVFFAIDAAASEFYTDGKYVIDGRELTSEELTKYYQTLTEKYKLISIEDSHNEDDAAGFQALKQAIGKTTQLVGDDLLVTNTERLQQAIEGQWCNSILIKPNQIGTVTETLECIKMAQEAGFGTIISHRSGETTDTFIADLAVGTAAGQIKTGSLSRGERTAKYNRLLEIADEV